MINIKKLPTAADGRIVKALPKKDPDGGIGAIIWEVDVLFDVNTLGDAKVLNEIVPGASSVYESGQLGSKAEAKDQSDYDVIRCSFWSNQDNKKPKRISSCHAAIKQAIVKTKGPVAVFILKMKLYGLITEQAIKIVDHLEEDVLLRLDSVKNEAVTTYQEPKHGSKVGWIAVLKDPQDFGEIGVVVAVDATVDNPYSDGYILLAEDGKMYEVEKSNISTIVKTPFGEKYKEHIDQYNQMCGTLGLHNDFCSILEALATSFIDGGELDASILINKAVHKNCGEI